MSAISCSRARSRPSAATDARRSRQAAPRGCKRGGVAPVDSLLSRAHRDRGPCVRVSFRSVSTAAAPLLRRLRRHEGRIENGGPAPFFVLFRVRCQSATALIGDLGLAGELALRLAHPACVLQKAPSQSADRRSGPGRQLEREFHAPKCSSVLSGPDPCVTVESDRWPDRSSLRRTDRRAHPAARLSTVLLRFGAVRGSPSLGEPLSRSRPRPLQRGPSHLKFLVSGEPPTSAGRLRGQPAGYAVPRTMVRIHPGPLAIAALSRPRSMGCFGRTWDFSGRGRCLPCPSSIAASSQRSTRRADVGRSRLTLRELRGHQVRQFTPRTLEPLAVEEEGRRTAGARSPTRLDVGENALAKCALLERGHASSRSNSSSSAISMSTSRKNSSGR